MNRLNLGRKDQAYQDIMKIRKADTILSGKIHRSIDQKGDAYGQLVDIAYVVDLKNKVEFFLSAAIYCNSDGVLNDDKYDYDTVGLPFLQHLGQVIYEYELKRERKRSPDLAPFVFEYDK